eukprot:9501022-Pyramimonas_sp.AAC.1
MAQASWVPEADAMRQTTLVVGFPAPKVWRAQDGGAQRVHPGSHSRGGPGGKAGVCRGLAVSVSANAGSARPSI